LMIAAQNGQTEAVELLLEAGANIEVEEEEVSLLVEAIH